MSAKIIWKDWIGVADNIAWDVEQVRRYSQGLTTTFNDSQYFQGLREAAKDPAMVAYYENLLRRYD